ncbi:amino acid/polyamine/organocation transporter (APC superfamily) [Actinomycetospora succinea]|uniref:Amino acid/polyamine/organocation transporter (APC superfamily) n=1 Tax=Actinomycetospora succinea TaxID=663603 RepID=A0A4R6V998_9PSEU|nr:APC family permease [Actinomycetospora succinea]TDQ55796.1 amino acid/polyamine/organocation transporter (APC superfamily) [Actinomycetospora succinea]
MDEATTPTRQGTTSHAEDDRLLNEFGYRQELPRVLRFWTNWALGFAFISPIVGLYTVVALGAQTAGPAWVWVLPIVLVGQLFVALVYAHLASRWPLAGGIYQWSRRLIGPAYGWWAGWIYMWALVLTLSTVAYGGGFFLGQLLGWEEPTTAQSVLLGLIVMAIFTSVNAAGLHLLRWVVNIGIACELVASIGIGVVLISLFRVEPVSVLVDTSLTPDGVPFLPAFIAALAIGGWVILGFDACGSVAEETREPRRQVPRAIVVSLITVGAVDMLAACALVLAHPDIGAVISGASADPVSDAVVAGLGEWAAKPFLVVVVIAFIACGIAVQATGVRVVWSYSRDGMLPLSRVWRRVSTRNQTPLYAVALVAVLSALAFVYANALTVLVAFATGAYYVGFLAPVVALLYLRLRGRWRGAKGERGVGTAGLVINIVAVLWLTFELINIAWPRDLGLPWWQTYAFLLGLACFGAVGLAYFLVSRPDRRFVQESESMGQVVPESTTDAGRPQDDGQL